MIIKLQRKNKIKKESTGNKCKNSQATLQRSKSQAFMIKCGRH